jgi:predicted NBD/HSP70 family sugar kinase
MALSGKATHQQTRALNTSLVLRTLYDAGPISRADLARRTGLTRTSVSDLVAGLIADGLAREVGRGPSTGGKAPILVCLEEDSRHVIALDLGEFIMTAAVVNLRGQVRRAIERPVDGRDGATALALVYELIDALVPDTRPTLLGIGVGTPGIVDAASGTIVWAVNLDWHDLPLGRLLGERYGVPVSIANDSRAAALAAYLFAGERRPANLVAVKVGRGIGAGVVLNGELFHGDGYGAGEIGHIVVEDDGEACRCGRFGCLETVASARAIVARARGAARQAPELPLAKALARTGTITLDDVRTALESGDEQARGLVTAAGRALGRALAGLIGTLNVQYLVLQGAVTALGDPWLEAVRDEATRHSLDLLARGTRIEIAPEGENVVLLGASALLLTRELGLTVHR